MPLINHTPEFLAKQAIRQKIKEAQEKKKVEQQIVDYYEQISRFRELKPEESEEYKDLLFSLTKHKIPVLEFYTSAEAEFLQEMIRFCRLSGQFTKDAESYRTIESIDRKNRLNIFHLQQLEDLGLGPYYRKYILLRRKSTKGK